MERDKEKGGRKEVGKGREERNKRRSDFQYSRRKQKAEGGKMALRGTPTCGVEEIDLRLTLAADWKTCEAHPSQEYKPLLAINTALSFRWGS